MKRFASSGPRLWWAAIAAAGLWGTGCTSMAVDVADHLAERSLKHEDAACLFAGEVLRYHQCLETRGGTCPSGDVTVPLPHSAPVTDAQGKATPVEPALASHTQAALAPGHPGQHCAAALNHPLTQKLAAAHNQLSGHGSGPASNGGSTVGLNLSLRQVKDLHHTVATAVASGSCDALAEHTQQHLKTVAAQAPGSPSHHEAKKDARVVAFVREYIAAYFREGHIFEIDFKLDPQTLQCELAQSLARHTPSLCVKPAGGSQSGDGSCPDHDTTTSDGAQCAPVATALYQAAGGQSGPVDKQLLKLGPTEFVAREGSYRAGFRGFEIDIDPTAHHLVSFRSPQPPPQSQAQLQQLLAQKAQPQTPRQAREAAARAEFLGVGEDLLRVFLEAVFDAHSGLPAQGGASGLSFSGANQQYALPPVPQGMDLSKIATIDDRVEAVTGVLVDRIIRGIGPLSINNAALEQAVVTLVATTVRKATEKATWCWFACGLDQEVSSAVKGVEEKMSHLEDRLGEAISGEDKGSKQKGQKAAAGATASKPHACTVSGSSASGGVALHLAVSQ